MTCSTLTDSHCSVHLPFKQVHICVDFKTQYVTVMVRSMYMGKVGFTLVRNESGLYREGGGGVYVYMLPCMGVGACACMLGL